MSEAVTYEEVPTREYETVSAFVRYSFDAESGADADDDTYRALVEKDVVTPFGVYADGTLQSVILEVDTQVRIRDRTHDATILSFIATPPEYRRGGSLSAGFPKVFASCVERGYDICLGRTFKHGFYTQFGGEMVSTHARWTCEPSTLVSTVDRPRGRFRRLTPADWREIDAVHRAFSGEYGLSFERSQAYWNEVTFQPYEKRHHIAGWEHDGELRGYVVYDITTENGQTVLRELDTSYRDYEALSHLLYYLGNHDSQVDEVAFVTPEDAAVFSLVDRNGLSCERRPGPIFRVTNVANALERVRYPPDLEGTVTLAVSDETAPWNDETYRLSVADGDATCTVSSDEPAARLDVRAFTQLLVGYHDAETLEEISTLTVEDERTRTFLSRAFPRQRVFLRDEV
ncbi:GNAT family N-acetyltransferase [Natronobiforma cellulositropha]|uniref:GNAT family N-acetyltransferase n=1 Tax=Natronobiforma cellulositropha TaxID=1679076 RepID=UPI0021D61435|nr:GNAT family N-acetyltransferase [Natronobiforma cellulositropha]